MSNGSHARHLVTVGTATAVPTVAPSTQARLAHPAAPGQRHAQIVQIAAALIGQGFNTEAVYWQIRPNYGSDVTDSEIRSVIAWAVSRIPANTANRIGKTATNAFALRYRNSGSGFAVGSSYGNRSDYRKYADAPRYGGPHMRPLPQPLAKAQATANAIAQTAKATVTPHFSGQPLPLSLPQKAPLAVSHRLPQNTASETVTARAFARENGAVIAVTAANTTAFATETDPVTAIERYLGGFRCDESDLWERSPLRPAENWETDAITIIAALFRSGENVNIVSRYAITDGKARPSGYGTTQTRENWIAEIVRNGPPQSASGVWIRPNPTDGNGIADANVTAYRFLLAEFDTIPLPLQTAFIARLSLPIAAIMTSGGKSLHAWIRLNAANATDYRTLAARIFAALAPYGIDTANKNPARLSRLPGVLREIGSVTDNRQRLLYLNPEPKAERIIA